MDMETLQQNFATLSDLYQTVEDLYMHNDGIAQDDDVEDLLESTKEVIDEMGDLDENDFDGEDDMIQLNDSMVTLIEALGGIVDRMNIVDDEEDYDDDDDDVEMSYVDGLYAADGNGRDFVILFYESDEGDYAYVHDGTEEAIDQYTVENAELDDGTEYIEITVGGLSLGYVDDGDDVFIIDLSDGTIYAASHLTEDEAESFYSILNDD